MATRKPGSPARGTRSGRPILVLFDLLGRRWALRVLWELRDGPQTFRGLRARCEQVSPSVLNTRLRELIGARLVERGDGGYVLSRDAHALIEALGPLHTWSKRWGKRFS